MNKKLLKIMVLCCCILLVATACGKKEEQKKDSDQPTNTEIEVNVEDDSDATSGDNDDEYVEIEESFIAKEGNLKIAQDLYYSVEPGMTKEQVIEAIGEPSKEDNFLDGTESEEYVEWWGDSSTLTYSAEINGKQKSMLSVSIDRGVVSNVEIAYHVDRGVDEDISIAKEIGSNIEDVSVLDGKIRNGMNLREVVNILGNVYIESKKSQTGQKTFSWYDIQDHYCTVTFYNGRVSSHNHW